MEKTKACHKCGRTMYLTEDEGKMFYRCYFCFDEEEASE